MFGLSSEYEAILVLAAITWLEGLRNLPAGSIILQRVVAGGWTLTRIPEFASSIQIVAWWSPVVLPVVLPPPAAVVSRHGARRLTTRLTARLDRVRVLLPVLRLLGVVQLVALVVAVPLATARWSVWGFLGGVLTVVAMSAVIAIIATVGLRRVGRSRQEAAARTLSILWPFTTPRAAELVLAGAVAGTPSLIVARLLLGDEAMRVAIRPLVYDALTGACGREVAGSVRELYTDAEMSALVEVPRGRESGLPFCPRCGEGYQARITSCADCSGLPLVPARAVRVPGDALPTPLRSAPASPRR